MGLGKSGNKQSASVDTNPKINPIVPMAGVPAQLIQALNDRFREIRLSPTKVSPSSTVTTGGGGGGVSGPFQRTLLLKNTAVGNDIADHLTCWGPSSDHTVVEVRGVLRKAITSDLTLRINSVLAGVASVIGTFTIPSATAVDTPVNWTSGFATGTLQDQSVFTWDITASDGSTDPAGVASFTIEWQP